MIQKTANEEVIDIDLLRLFRSLLRKSWLMVLWAVFGAWVMFAVMFFFVPPRYESAVTFYVCNTIPGEVPLSNLSAGDISASRILVDSYIAILDTRQTLQTVIDEAGLDMDYDRLRDMIHAQTVEETELFRVGVTGEDPLLVQEIAQTICEVLPIRIREVLEGASVKVVDPAQVPESPVFPQYDLCALIGFVAGFAVCAVVLALSELTDTTIREEADIRKFWDGAILATVPDMTSKEEPARKIGFNACQAYKQLPVKLQYCFTDASESRVIGITGALHAEGKSVTAINLANTLARFQYRVVLVDCDLRRPVIARRLPVSGKMGLSAYLSCQCELEDLIQPCRLKEKEPGFHVVAAGQLPPEPVELLSAKRMKLLMQELRRRYDYVLLDLPPVGEVSDALAVAEETDGMILVVRRGICTGKALVTAVTQLQSVNTRILGVIYNCGTEKSQYGIREYGKIYS